MGTDLVCARAMFKIKLKATIRASKFMSGYFLRVSTHNRCQDRTNPQLSWGLIFDGASRPKNNASTAIKRFTSAINQQRHHSKNEGKKASLEKRPETSGMTLNGELTAIGSAVKLKNTVECQTQWKKNSYSERPHPPLRGFYFPEKSCNVAIELEQ
ncbi:MAG TPA: hypothetical protein VIU12_16435 [Chryseolinea sp.]